MVWLTKGNGRNGSGGKAVHETSNKWLLLENQLMKAIMKVRDGKGVDGCIFPIKQTNTGKGNMAWFVAWWHDGLSTSFYDIHTIYNPFTTLLLIINYYASSVIQKTSSPFKTSKMTWGMAT